MPNAPDVTVVVVNYDHAELLRACLTSLKHQCFQSFETIVVDNGSTDDSLATAREFAEKMPLRIIANETNVGFCRANNQAIAEARGRWVALLNNDAEAAPDWLAEMVRAGDSDRLVGMVASKILRSDDREVIDKVGHLIYPDGQNRGRGTGERDVGQYDGDPDVSWPDGCAALYRREMLEQIGGFDEDFFAYADDAELGLRARLAGWRAIYAPRAVVYHRVGSTLGRYSYQRLYLIERNRIWLVAKLFPMRMWPLTPLYFFARIAAVALATAYRRSEARRAIHEVSALGLVKCLLAANLDGLAGLPRMLRKRREIRALRKLSGRAAAELLRRYRLRLREAAFTSH